MITTNFIHKIVLIISWLLVCFASNSMAEAETLKAFSRPVLSDFEIFEDTDGTRTFADMSSREYDGRYTLYPEKTLSLGITTSVYWVRFKVLPPAGNEPAGETLLQLNNPNIDKINLYLPLFTQGTAEGQYTVQEVGVSRPSANRSIADNTWVFQLPSQYRPQDYLYLRLESTSALRLPVLIWPTADFISEMFWKNAGFGAFYGILGAMIVFNLFIYTVLRDRVYLYYVLYISFMFLYQFQVHGHFKLLLDLPYQLYNSIFWVWLAAAFSFSVYFTREFLQVAVTFPRLDTLLSVTVAIAMLQGVLGVTGHNVWANQIAHGLGIIGPIVFITAAVKRLAQGFTPARYYLIAWSVLSAGIIIWSLAAYLPAKFSAIDYLMAATAGESILLSLALAERMKTMRQEGEALTKSIEMYQNLSITDGLSGLYNKRFFDIRLKEEISEARKNRMPLSLFVIDVDHFKSYNDAYGHWEGDQVLVRLSKVVAGMLVGEQAAFRYGGEEFVILLPRTAQAEALDLAETLRETFSQERFEPGRATGVFVTVSIGVAELCRDDSPESFFQRADEALYQAKRNGRNQSVSI